MKLTFTQRHSCHFALAFRLLPWAAPLLLIALLLGSQQASAQSTDSIFRNAGAAGASKVSGKVVDMTPEGVVVDSRGKQETVAAQDIRKIVYAGQPAALDRTRERVVSGNYTQGLEELAKIEPKGGPRVEHEISYLKAFAKGKLAVSGSAQLKDAGTTVNAFLKKYKTSYHFYPMTELKGRLLKGLKLVDLAAAEFKVLTQAKWPEYRLKGHYLLAQAYNAQGKYADAIKQCDEIEASQDNSDLTQKYQRLAKCEKSKSLALAGTPDGVEETLMQLIKVENPDDKQLFAAAYNAWGVLYFKAGDWKKAREKFLLTHLLMSSESDSHAEALYYLSQIWPKFENTDEANKSRELLQSRYRNSYWAQQLN